MSNKYFPFYGGPFSQWFRCKFVVDGVSYNSAEQYMMAKKAEFFKDSDTKKKIMKAETPREQKQLGRKVKGFSENAWSAVAHDIVYRGNLAKFSQNQHLKDEMLAVEGKFVEASPTDLIWGVGLGADDPRIQDSSQWRGRNWLGNALSKVRDTLADNPNHIYK